MKPSNKRQQIIIAALIAVILGAGAIASTQYFFRLDMTADKSFSISKVSRNLFKEIPEQVRIVYYVSGRLYKERPEPKRVEDLLREYASTSRGKIRVEVVDPDATGEAGTVERLGIPPQQYQVTDKNQASVATVYTGVLIQYLDRQEILPTVFQTETLEYDLTRAVRKAVSGKERVAEVLIGDPDKTWTDNYTILLKALKNAGWEVRERTAGRLVGADVSLLIVLGNSGLDEFDLYPVNEYVRRGGAALIGMKGVNVNTQYGLTASPVGAEAAFSLLSSWGIKISKELVLDESCLTLPIQVQSPNGGAMVSLVKYAYWVSINQKNVSKENPVTSRFAGLDLYWPSPMEISKVDGLETEVLASSTDKAWRATKDFPLNPQEEYRFYEEKDSTGGKYALAAAVKGTFPDAFAGKKLPERAGAESDWADKKAVAEAKTAVPAKAIVFSSSDFATDLMQYSKGQFGFQAGGADINAEFLLSCADWLSSEDDIVSIRTRSYRDARLNKVEDPDAKRGVIFMTYLVTMAVVPLSVVAYGVIRLVRRKRREKNLRTKEA
jgi:ABC-type uncharacterized transport system involved in gliding motility auxiliary subunit